MLALLSDAQKTNPDHFTHEAIRDHLATMVFAGFETTSVLMQWMWYALDSRPDVAVKLRGEIAQCVPSLLSQKGLALTNNDLSRMRYLSMVIKETMRLYPPLWIISRQAIEEDHFGDFEVAPGTVIVLSQFVMHRHPRWWREPNAFIPERFAPGNGENIDEGLYFPFAYGARKCIGMRLAELEAAMVFAKLLPCFQVKLINAAANRFDPGITLKLKSALRAHISRLPDTSYSAGRG